MYKFVYFWIPVYSDFRCDLKSTIKRKDISDNVENKENILELEFLENYNIKVNYNNDEYLLEYISHKDNGLFIYKFNNINEGLLRIQVYHLFKDICHIHTSHDNEEDSLLNAYISDNDKDIKGAIQFYSETYIHKFKGYERIKKEFININTNDFKIDEIKNQKELLLKAKEEILYAMFLSKDTNFYNIFVNFEKKFDILLDKLHIKETSKLFKVNDTINKWQFGLAILGISLGIYFGITGANDKLQKIESNKIEKLYEITKQQIGMLQNINSIIKTLNTNIEQNKIKIDTILKNQEQLKTNTNKSKVLKAVNAN